VLVLIWFFNRVERTGDFLDLGAVVGGDVLGCLFRGRSRVVIDVDEGKQGNDDSDLFHDFFEVGLVRAVFG